MYCKFFRNVACIWLILVTIQNSFAQYHKIDSLENLLDRPDDTVKANILTELSENYRSLNLDTAAQFAMQANQLSKTLGFQAGQYNALRTLNSVYMRKGDLKNAIAVNKECLAVAEDMGNKKTIAMAKGFLGMSYRYLNYYSKAFEELTAAINLFKELGDTENQASFSLSIGNIYLDLKDYETARKYYQQAIDLSRDDLQLQHVVYINLGEILLEEKKYTESFASLDRALLHFEGRQPAYVAYILYLKAKGYHQLGETERSKSFFQRALALYDDLQNSSGKTRCFIELGNIAHQEKQYEKALQYFQSALDISVGQKKYGQLVKIYQGLVESYKAMGLYEKSLENQMLASVCKDSLSAISQREKLNELQVRYETDLAEKEIVQLKAERNDYYRIMGLLGLLVIASIVIVALIVRRHRIDVNISEISKKELQAELKTKEEVTHHLRGELEFKVKELTSFTLNMIQKKEMLETIKSGIEEVRTQTEGEAKAKLNKILSTITFSQRLDKDWENFKLYFEQVHQGFFDDLRAIYPELNANDLRLCALIRLNLDTKQIASVMDIAPESAKVAKHRIRKKLGLTNNDNLHAFFSSLASARTGASRPALPI